MLYFEPKIADHSAFHNGFFTSPKAERGRLWPSIAAFTQLKPPISIVQNVVLPFADFVSRAGKSQNTGG